MDNYPEKPIEKFPGIPVYCLDEIRRRQLATNISMELPEDAEFIEQGLIPISIIKVKNFSDIKIIN